MPHPLDSHEEPGLRARLERAAHSSSLTPRQREKREINRQRQQEAERARAEQEATDALPEWLKTVIENMQIKIESLEDRVRLLETYR